jgi:tetratricopeptide (TPR) repeat protein
MPDALDQARAAYRGGDVAGAARLCREGLRADPARGPAWHLLGEALLRLGQHAEAADAFGRAARLRPDEADAALGLGLALVGLQNRQEAVDAFREALRRRPGHAEAMTQLGVALAGLGRLDEAIGHLRRAAELKPGSAPAHNNLGVALAEHGKAEEAAVCLGRAVELDPGYPEAHYNLGNVLRDLGRRDEAVEHYRRAADLRPGYAEAYNNLGLALTEAGRHAEAAVLLRQAARLRPGSADARNNLGLALCGLGRFAEAEAAFHEALALDPGHAQAHANLGSCYKDSGRMEEALACYGQALRLDPASASAHYNRSLALLQAGRYAEGWPEYEWRWRRQGVKQRLLPKPRWDGGPLEGRTILLWCEQGLGDAIQFVRYAKLVKERGARVLLECPDFMVPLFSTCPGVDRVEAEGSQLRDYEVQAPLMSLPELLGTTLENVPAEVPYLQAEPKRVEAWRRRLEDVPGFRVGVVWQGNRHFPWDHFRSVPLEVFAPLAAMEGVRLVSLQKGHGAEQVAALRGRFPVEELAGLDESGGAFLDTAAVMRCLDLVVTADTAAAHLAGALDVPAWVVLSTVTDWRWLMGRQDTPWYPSVRLFRQARLGDWEGVFARMAAELGPPAEGNRRRAFRVEVSPGELLDRLTILQIKSERITDPAKLAHVRAELAALRQAWGSVPETDELRRLAAELRAVNEALWEAEDVLRVCEREGDFGARFVELARSVYRSNDRRGALKRRVDDLLGAHTREQKEYSDYGLDVSR